MTLTQIPTRLDLPNGLPTQGIIVFEMEREREKKKSQPSVIEISPSSVNDVTQTVWFFTTFLHF